MPFLIKEEFFNENNYTFLYQFPSEAEFQQIIERVMVERGYQNIGNHIYEKGNVILKMLLGSFYHYYKIEIKPEGLGNNHVRVSIKKWASSVRGGVTSMNNMQQELSAIKERFKSI
ncbi:hypothetical protein DES39_0429 [Orbus hercynius]|uniref:Uncharacterized protein n=1 Tax=Orbus hercynius TaxID=593135 RepID=A0A495RIT9_9GAMM|nr:hypothetical protein [Orbus hercynius]RKS87210.1 hypothetical protein DES39_0429 [Orbus hercynius]